MFRFKLKIHDERNIVKLEPQDSATGFRDVDRRDARWHRRETTQVIVHSPHPFSSAVSYQQEIPCIQEHAEADRLKHEVTGGGKRLELQAARIEHWCPYPFQPRPIDGAQAVTFRQHPTHDGGIIRLVQGTLQPLRSIVRVIDGKTRLSQAFSDKFSRRPSTTSIRIGPASQSV